MGGMLRKRIKVMFFCFCFLSKLTSLESKFSLRVKIKKNENVRSVVS